ncbi:MAG: hypothetical protein PF505_02250 [Vallitaleaceae bacterium]|jgi:hypothetical protein|nr:hypothetical protein [Vallitaleaceae bacterium]
MRTILIIITICMLLFTPGVISICDRADDYSVYAGITQDCNNMVSVTYHSDLI